MMFKGANRVRAVTVAVAATVALSAASPAGAQVHSPVGPTVDGRVHHADRNGVERRAERFRGRYQLQLPQARRV